MKNNLKNKAVLLRRKGKSVGEIATTLFVSKSSVSRWVKSVALSPGHQEILNDRSHGSGKSLIASRAMQEKYRLLRQAAREEGRQKAAEGDLLHAFGCALYWAEGTKGRSTIALANTDVWLAKKFFVFLLVSMTVPVERIHVQVTYHGDAGNAPVAECQQFWSSHLGVPFERILMKINADKRVRSGKKKARHKYGMVVFTCSDTLLIQKIYGAIEIYGGAKIQEY